MIDITVLCSPFNMTSMLSFSLAGAASYTTSSLTRRFCKRPLSFGSPTGTFLFSEVSTGHFLSSLTPYSDLSRYGLLAIMTYFICGAQIRMCLVVLGLYPISMPYHTF